MLHEPRQRARDRDARGICVGLAENRRELLIVVLQFEPADDRLAIGRPQTLQGGLVSLDPLAADRDVERGCAFRWLRIGQFGGGGPAVRIAGPRRGCG